MITRVSLDLLVWAARDPWGSPLSVDPGRGHHGLCSSSSVIQDLFPDTSRCTRPIARLRDHLAHRYCDTAHAILPGHRRRRPAPARTRRPGPGPVTGEKSAGRTLQHNLTGRHESANASRAHSADPVGPGSPGFPESPDSPGRFTPALRRYCGCAASHPQGGWRERCVKASYGLSWKREGLRRLSRDAPWPENGGAGSWTHQQFSSARRTR